MNRASLDDSGEIVAKYTKRAPLFFAAVVVLLWLAGLIAQGLTYALEISFVLLLGASLGAPTLLTRLRFGDGRLVRTMGPWRTAQRLQRSTRCPRAANA